MGFPSGHATAAAAYFGAVIYLAASLPPRVRPVVRVVAVMLILGVGVARVMLRAHWPSDVLGGFAFGLALASTAALIDSLGTTPPTTDQVDASGEARRLDASRRAGPPT